MAAGGGVTLMNRCGVGGGGESGSHLGQNTRDKCSMLPFADMRR